MGSSFTANHILNSDKLTKAQFKKKFTDMMKAKGYTTADADEAELTYALAFSSDRKWVTVLSADSENALTETSAFAKALGTQVLGIELVDSDFAAINLIDKTGVRADIIFLGSQYFDEVSELSPPKWQSLLGIDWPQVEKILNTDYTFAEAALGEFAEIIGMDGKNILLEYDEVGDSAQMLYFKWAGEKRLTLNAAFKQVFGELLEPLGFVKIKSKHPYYVRAVTDEIVHIITVKNEWEGTPGAKAFDILGGSATVYRREINLDISIMETKDWLSSTSIFYVKTYENTAEFDRKFLETFYSFSYLKNENESLIDAMEYAAELTEEFMLPVLYEVNNLESFKKFYVKYNMWLDTNVFRKDCDYSRTSIYHEGLLYIKTDDRKCYEKLCRQLKYAIDHDLAEDIEELQDKLSLYDDPEVHARVLEELERRKIYNQKRLRDYGVKI